MEVDQPQRQPAQVLSPKQQRLQQLLEQQQAAFAAKAGGRQVPEPPAAAAAPAAQPQQKRQRVPDATVQAVALEQRLPQYSINKQWGSLLGGGGSGRSSTDNSSSRAARPFTSLLLAPATMMDPPAMAAAAAVTGGLTPALRWQLLPGSGAVSARILQGGGPAAGAASVEGRQQDASAEDDRRYFTAPPGGAAARPPPWHEYWARQYEQLLQQRPEDEELWLSYAVRHAVEACGSSRSEGLTSGERCLRMRAWVHATGMHSTRCCCRLQWQRGVLCLCTIFLSAFGNLLFHPSSPTPSTCCPAGFCLAADARERILMVLKRGLEHNRCSAAAACQLQCTQHLALVLDA